MRGRRGFEDASGVASASQRGVDEDSPMLQRRDDEFDDSVDEDRLVIHWVSSLSVSIFSVPEPE
jgi:hypothetical protein